MYFVYVLANPDNQIYIGQTNDLTHRFAQHNDPADHLTRHTKKYPGPWRLVHAESLDTRTDALRREKQLKSTRGRDWLKIILE
ncbi:MAG: GIY-YIG nuclease family protein [Verrucomicrobiota bacterium]